MTRRLNSLEDTRHFAGQLVKTLPGGTLLLLVGPLGAGKTTLTQYLGRALGTRAHISSPTYTLIHEYPTEAGLLVHIDAYRLPDAGALLNLGLDDYLERARLVVVEWGEGLLGYYPEAYMLKLEPAGEKRVATLLSPGQR